jgi:SPP1 family predicted phage head-tail adaptor
MGRFDIPTGTGAKRHRITLQTKTKTRDDYGQVTTAWASGGTYWALVEFVDGQQVQQGARVVAERTGTITMRWIGDLDTTDQRFLFGDRVLHIISIQDVGERRRELRLKWREVVGEAP